MALRILTVVGARPQFIKAAALHRALDARPNVEQILIHTGQHYDPNMSDVFFDELEIPAPDYQLGIGSGSHGAQTGQMLEKIEDVLLQRRPDWVVVYGDTNSTLAGAVAAVKLHLPLAHVEAGLRSFNRRMPEEINRVLTDHASDLLLAPTTAAVDNLNDEGITPEAIHLVGDVMFDAALFYAEKAQRQSDILARWNLKSHQYVLATVHRAENTDELSRLRAIVEGLGEIAKQLPVVLPLHPRTRAALAREGLLESAQTHLRIEEPVGYLDMVRLERDARLIVTDSGGVQKEAYFCRVPCVTLREETEWKELVEAGWNRLVSPQNADLVRQGVTSMLEAPPPQETTDGLYGGGDAAGSIAKLLGSD